MPPRSYYLEPQKTDYLAFAKAYLSDEYGIAKAFIDEKGLPYIRNADHLAAYLGVSPSLVRQILHKKEYHYRQFPLPKADGPPRLISTPKTYLKTIQWWIGDNILSHVALGDEVHGFRQGHSYVTNARVHLGCNHILNMDIEQFFPSITKPMTTSVFTSLGYGKEGAGVLAELCTLDGSTPTGAPTSPAIGNMVLVDFDRAMTKLAGENTLKYTRYADDLTFSSNEWISPEFALQVEEVLKGYGFAPKGTKTKFMGRSDRMEITGVTINEGTNPPREWRNWARGFLHRARMNPHQYAHEWKKIAGIYGTLKSMDPDEDKLLTKRAKQVLNLVRS
ncbi:MAG TPA: hypothetical protein DIT67_12955 [Octadecabacter sp.]|nr:hypothetical protein [Octadecabacter sp.]